MENRYSQGFAVGLGIGLGVGLALGILYAPRKGVKTRAMLLRGLREGQQFVIDKEQDLVDAATRVIERNKRVVQQAADQVVHAFEAGKRAVAG